jgi:hypothetical protein
MITNNDFGNNYEAEPAKNTSKQNSLTFKAKSESLVSSKVRFPAPDRLLAVLLDFPTGTPRLRYWKTKCWKAV